MAFSRAHNNTLNPAVNSLSLSLSLCLSEATQTEDTSRLFSKPVTEYDSEPVLSTFPTLSIYDHVYLLVHTGGRFAKGVQTKL
jgi:hypothetical protein